MSGDTADSNVRYSRDKPNDCKFCYYWQGRKKGCLMGEQNCACLIREEASNEHSQCDGCPYGKYSPCIGWCTVDVINAVFKNRLAEYMASTGKSYKSHLATIRSWARRERRQAASIPRTTGTYSHDNYRCEERESQRHSGAGLV